jgi:hypothetical protein
LTAIIEVLKRTTTGLPLARFIAEEVKVLEEEGIRTLGEGDLLVLGVGPIMDDPALVQWESWFQWAERAGASILIAGCGLGPLRQRKTISIAESLLRHANAITLRNNLRRNVACAARFAHAPAPGHAFLCAPLLVPRVGPQNDQNDFKALASLQPERFRQPYNLRGSSSRCDDKREFDRGSFI